MPEITISKAQSRQSTLNRNIEILSLTPSTLITLWEIDTGVTMDEIGLKDSPNYDYIFRFHNSSKLGNTSVYWRSKEYYPLPIQAEGFEYVSKGSPQAPKLTLAINEDIPLDDPKRVALALLKSRLKQLNDLAGVKITRRRVFAKYIDGFNFENISKEDLAGQGFAPDPNMQFDPDIYYIDRKSLENKSVIEFELGSIIDVEGVKLPGRAVYAKRCPFAYRGFGCLYEYRSNRVSFIHGTSAESTLPPSAPPVANSKNEKIQDILGPATKITYVGIYIKEDVYQKGHAVHIQKDGIKYYFVSSINDNKTSPPNPLFWITDECAKDINGCRLRWADLLLHDGSLSFGGFPGILTTT